jgi:hypothetical protein
MKPQIIPGNRALLDQLGVAFPHGARTLIGLVGERPVGAVGVYPERGRLILFAHLTPEARVYKRYLLLAGRRILASIAHIRAPVEARANPHIAGSARLLEHLGFRKMWGDVFRWTDG